MQQLQQMGVIRPGTQPVSALTMPHMFPGLASRAGMGASTELPVIMRDSIPTTVNANAVRQARRIYVGNIPYAVSEVRKYNGHVEDSNDISFFGVGNELNLVLVLVILTCF